MSEAMPFELLKGQGKTGQIKLNQIGPPHCSLIVRLFTAVR